MSGHLDEAYESFLLRCIGGIHKEQEAFSELAKAMEGLKVLVERGQALGLQEGWVFEGAEELTTSYQKGKEAFDKEGAVYTALPALKNLVRHREKALATWAEELRRQEEEWRFNKRAQEEERARRRREAAAVEARRKREQEEARRKRDEKARRRKLVFSLLLGIAAWQIGGLGLVVALLAIFGIIFYVRGRGGISK